MPTIPVMQELGVTPQKVGGTQQVSSQRGMVGPGLFGPFRGKSLPRTLQVIGATLQQIENPQGQLNAFAANEADQQRQLAEEMAQARQQKTQDAEQAQYDQYVQTLDPQYQPLARLDREGFLRSQMPLSPEDRARQDLQDRQFQETLRHNRVSEGIDYMRATRESQQGMPTLAEARQWTNGYNDDVRTTLNDLGNMRAAIPYAHQVIQSRGTPTGNFRMNDVALLRAAARAQTGPGVLMQSEVFGTLSPSLQQDLTTNLAYTDISRSGLRPEDRLALARYVEQSQRNASGDLWRRYNDVENVLSARNVDPSNVGVSAPEYLHPDDMDSFGSVPDSSFTAGRNYVAPSGRQYTYLGDGRWRYSGRQAYDRSRQVNRDRSRDTQQSTPNRVRIDASGNVIP